MARITSTLPILHTSERSISHRKNMRGEELETTKTGLYLTVTNTSQQEKRK